VCGNPFSNSSTDTVHYTTADCTGTPYLYGINANSMFLVGTVEGTTLYYKPTSATPQTIATESNLQGGTCSTYSQSDLFVEAATFDLSVFVAPFHVESAP
jgi:hypothetical protein